MVQPLGDGMLKQALALMPGSTVGLGCAQVRLRGPDAGRGLIRVEVLGAVSADGGPADAALAGTVGASQHENAGGVGSLVHGQSLCFWG